MIDQRFAAALARSMITMVDLVAIGRENHESRWGHVRINGAWHALLPAKDPFLAECFELIRDDPVPNFLAWGPGNYPAELPTYRAHLALQEGYVNFLVSGPVVVEFGADLTLRTIRTKVIRTA